MENLTIQENPAGGPAGPSETLTLGPDGAFNLGPGVQQAMRQQEVTLTPSVPQLPPQMFTTAAQMLDLTDKKITVILRDGKKLIGVMRSFDQFGNVVLQDTIERIFLTHHHIYADIDRGTFLVRGENIVLLGEIDLDKEDDIPEPYELAPIEKVFALKKEEDKERKEKDKKSKKKLASLGFEGEHSGEVIF